MTRALEGQPQTENPLAPANEADRDPVRAALHELVTLSAATASREVEIEQTHAAAVENAAKDLARVKSNLDQRVKGLHEELQQKSQSRTEQITQQHQANLDELKRGYDARVQKIKAEYETVNQDVSAKMQQAVWLTESLLEGVQAGLKEESKKGKEEHAKHLESLEALEQEAARLIETYRQQPPADVAIPEEKIEGDPQTAFDTFRAEAEQHMAELEIARRRQLIRRDQADLRGAADLRDRRADLRLDRSR